MEFRERKDHEHRRMAQRQALLVISVGETASRKADGHQPLVRVNTGGSAPTGWVRPNAVAGAAEMATQKRTPAASGTLCGRKRRARAWSTAASQKILSDPP